MRRAVTGLRTLLGRFPASKRDLRQLLWNLDAGQAVALDVIPGARAVLTVPNVSR